MLDRRSFERAIAEMSPFVRRAFMTAINRITGRAAIAMLERAIAQGRLDDAARFAGFRPGSWSALSEALRGAYFEAGVSTAAVAPASLGLVFDIDNSGAQQWLATRGGRRITGSLSDDVLAVVRQVMGRTIAGEGSPRSAALDLVGRINRRTGRREGGLIGLTPNQAGWVQSLKEELASGDPTRMAGYFGRELRDKRFDRIVERAMAAGKPVGAGDIRRIAGRYADTVLRMRGETIARTETIQAMSAGRDEAIRQATEQGMVQGVVKTWNTAGGGRTRDTHASMDQQKRAQDEPFTTGGGYSLQFPGDSSLGAPARETINCRCWVSYEVDWIAQAAA